MPELTFHYKRRPILMLLVIIIGFATAAGFIYMGLNVESPELSFMGFYAADGFAIALIWFFAIFMGALGVFGVYALLRSGQKPKVIRLTQNALIAPKAPISKKIVAVSYADMTSVQIEGVMQELMLVVKYDGGKLSITKSWLEDKDAFDTIQFEIKSRWRAAMGGNVS